MTLQSLQEHEAHYLPLFEDDYRRKSLERLVRRFVTGRRVLDLRCLTGHLAVELALQGFEVTALDGLNEAAMCANAYARARGLRGDFAGVWDLADLIGAVRGAQFDTVLCLDTLQHAKDDDALLAQLVRVVAEGGRLIINAPAFPALHGKRDTALGHLRRYTRCQVQELLERHGFCIELMRPWNFIGLPMYALLEGVLRIEVSERLRHGRRGPVNRVTNRLLRWWYIAVENRLRFPCGLTWFVIAHKEGQGRERS